MSIGCSIVGSKGLPVSEVITDGVEGLLVPMDSPSFWLNVFLLS